MSSTGPAYIWPPSASGTGSTGNKYVFDYQQSPAAAEAYTRTHDVHQFGKVALAAIERAKQLTANADYYLAQAIIAGHTSAAAGSRIAIGMLDTRPMNALGENIKRFGDASFAHGMAACIAQNHETIAETARKEALVAQERAKSDDLRVLEHEKAMRTRRHVN